MIFNQSLLTTTIVTVFFTVQNLIAYKYIIKEKTTIKFLFVIFLIITETVVTIYIKSFFVYQFTLTIIGFLILLNVMTISDIEKMEVPEWTLVIFPMYSVCSYIFLCFRESRIIYENIITTIIAFLALAALGKLYNDMLGGADIVMVSSVALTFGLMHTLYMLIIGCMVSIVGMYFYSKIKNIKPTGVPLPFLPGLTIGFVLAFFLT